MHLHYLIFLLLFQPGRAIFRPDNYQPREGFEAQEKARLEERRAKVLAFIEAHSKM